MARNSAPRLSDETDSIGSTNWVDVTWILRDLVIYLDLLGWLEPLRELLAGARSREYERCRRSDVLLAVQGEGSADALADRADRYEPESGSSSPR